MSLPTNSGLAKDRGCSPVSSNCVVWQGPDLECINLCKGDTISEVVAKMAIELCEIIELFELEDFDFTCLGIANSERPENIKELIQVLINRVCEIEGIQITGGGGTTSSTGSDCPENCIVSIADCFHYVNNVGDDVTSMPLLDYVTAIGNRVCEILDTIGGINDAIGTLNEIVNGDGSGGEIANPGGVVKEVKEIREAKADKLSFQYVNSTDLDPSGQSKYITDAVRTVENDYLALKKSMGPQSKMYAAVAQEANTAQEKRLAPGGNALMNSISGWKINPEDIADAITNLWKTTIDLRAAVEYIQENCCSTSCSDLHFNFQAQLTVNPGDAYITIFTNGSTGFDGWTECSGTTNIIIKDASGNSTTAKVGLIALIDNPIGYQLSLNGTPIDTGSDITVTAETCFNNAVTNYSCENKYDVVLYSSASCPAITITAYSASVNYQFVPPTGYSFIMNIYVAGSSVPFAAQIIKNPGVLVQNIISGLTEDTNYELELVFVNGKGEETPCPKQPFSTLPNACTPPINPIVNLTI